MSTIQTLLGCFATLTGLLFLLTVFVPTVGDADGQRWLTLLCILSLGFLGLLLK